MSKIGFWEIFLFQFIIYLILWLSYDYLAALLTTIFGLICFFLLLVAWISERIEPSKVPRWYFTMMIASVLAPLLAAGVYYLIMGGGVDFG